MKKEYISPEFRLFLIELREDVVLGSPEYIGTNLNDNNDDIIPPPQDDDDINW